jgi:hypothetical protein
VRRLARTLLGIAVLLLAAAIVVLPTVVAVRAVGSLGPIGVPVGIAAVIAWALIASPLAAFGRWLIDPRVAEDRRGDDDRPVRGASSARPYEPAPQLGERYGLRAPLLYLVMSLAVGVAIATLALTL